MGWQPTAVTLSTADITLCGGLIQHLILRKLLSWADRNRTNQFKQMTRWIYILYKREKSLDKDNDFTTRELIFVIGPRFEPSKFTDVTSDKINIHFNGMCVSFCIYVDICSYISNKWIDCLPMFENYIANTILCIMTPKYIYPSCKNCYSLVGIIAFIPNIYPWHGLVLDMLHDLHRIA